MGGMQGFGPVVTPGCELIFHEDWEPRVFAMSLLSGVLDRAVIERMPAPRYLDAGYYERWLWATEQGLLAKGSIDPGEIEAWEERLAGGEPSPVRSDPESATGASESLRKAWTFAEAEDPRFRTGDRVRARRMHPYAHTRCPRYIRGVAGTIETILGADVLPNAPEDSPKETVYSVAFASADLWGESAEATWNVFVDLWEGYLEPAEGSDG
jgi:nitrile hydratase beta subunit